MKEIRFPVMEQKEFVSVVLDCDILTKKECFAGMGGVARPLYSISSGGTIYL